jgi:hypothetical protein
VAKDASTNQNSTTVSINVNYNPPDTTPPAAVANLATGTVTANSMALSWTAPGDDGNIGTATSYDIRYALAQITESNWATATQAGGEPAPLVAGTAQSFTVTGLSCGTTYFFALKSSDEIPNISAISNSPSQSTSACAPPAGTPVLAYSFNEGFGSTANDSSGNGNNGILVNGATWSTGHSGSAVNLDGINDYVNAGNIAALNGLTAVTVSAWVKGSVGSASADAVIVAKDAAFALVVGLDSLHKAQFGVKSGSAWYGFPASTTNVDDGNFHFLTGVYDGNTLRVYVDGIQQGSQNIGNLTLNAPSANLEIGSCIGGPDCSASGEMWSGIVDDVRIYNRALSPAEIQADMNNSI